ncbi:MAG: cell filamentation protein Fic [Firmicutes bacterium]|nr:cell filamentation protein Fic [Bacillota bacterium]
MEEKFNQWQISFGLSEIDNEKPSVFLQSLAEANIIGLISDEQAEELLSKHYMEMGIGPQYGTDVVILRIKRFLTISDFDLSKEFFYAIHRYIFKGVFPDAGNTRNVNISKKEPILNDESVIYSPMQHIEEYLDYDFMQERKKNYRGKSPEEVINLITPFITNIWQAHPFCDGNTRTTSVFLEKYLNFLGFPTNNDVFKENATYFRAALVRANYTTEGKIEPTFEYIKKFLRKLLIDPTIELNMDELYISPTRS